MNSILDSGRNLDSTERRRIVHDAVDAIKEEEAKKNSDKLVPYVYIRVKDEDLLTA